MFYLFEFPKEEHLHEARDRSPVNSSDMVLSIVTRQAPCQTAFMWVPKNIVEGVTGIVVSETGIEQKSTW